MRQISTRSSWYLWILAAAFAVTMAVYWPGLQGGFLFDDYPNIVDNKGVQPTHASFSSLAGAALSSPASDFKRPLASLSFAANFLASGLDPYGMKLTNLVIHLLNGLLVFLLARALLDVTVANESCVCVCVCVCVGLPTQKPQSPEVRASPGVVAALIAAGWMLLPINLTGVLYVVQRMESIANLFVLLGLLGYVHGRRRMLSTADLSPPATSLARWRSLALCAASITLPALVGALAKETAIMLPLYATLIEWFLFRFRLPDKSSPDAATAVTPQKRDRRVISLFLLVLVLPMGLGLAWLLPGLLKPETWATRDFTLGTRLLSEARILVDYIAWTLLPTPGALSFYHDDFIVSTGLLKPASTLASIAFLAALIFLAIGLRRRQPLTVLGVALFLGCHLLTGTILPLELVYEHRNYFASFGLLLAIVPLLAVQKHGPMALPRLTLLVGLFLCWTTLTAITSYAWGNPLRLAEDLATRAPQSPRAQYELGRTYIIYSRYDPASPFIDPAYKALENAASLPKSSILPEQALIFMNARMHLPIKDAWWESLVSKLEARKATVQDESSLAALTQCVREGECNLSEKWIMKAYMAALTHPEPSARLLANYADYSWNTLHDWNLGLRLITEAVNNAPNEPAYLITQVRMLAAESKRDEAMHALKKLQTLNYGGRLDGEISQLFALPELK